MNISCQKEASHRNFFWKPQKLWDSTHRQKFLTLQGSGQLFVPKSWSGGQKWLGENLWAQEISLGKSPGFLRNYLCLGGPIFHKDPIAQLLKKIFENSTADQIDVLWRSPSPWDLENLPPQEEAWVWIPPHLCKVYRFFNVYRTGSVF